MYYVPFAISRPFLFTDFEHDEYFSTKKEQKSDFIHKNLVYTRLN